MLVAGVDFGSKLAGTTVVAWLNMQTAEVQWQQAAKNQDADAFLKQVLIDLSPKLVGFDAPLSLPYVYNQALDLPLPRDYFFRQGDRELRAMSPMFLGGLTARAMQLREILAKEAIALYEVYPAEQARRLELRQWAYKKETTYMPDIQAFILKQFGFEIQASQQARTWHEIDALLALLSAHRIHHQKHEAYGNSSEGQIFV